MPTLSSVYYSWPPLTLSDAGALEKCLWYNQLRSTPTSVPSPVTPSCMRPILLAPL